MEDELFIEQSMLVTEKPYSWDSIPDNFVKKNLEEAILNPLKYPSVFSAFENSWRSILFYGMAGSGKTYTLKALASKLNMNYLFASSSDFISIYIGDGER